MPNAGEIDTIPTELASVVFGLLHYLSDTLVVQRPVSTETSSVGFVQSSPVRGINLKSKI